MALDYAKAASELHGGYWRVPIGETVVTVLSELSERSTVTYGDDGGPTQTVEKVDLEISVDGVLHTWRVTANDRSRQSLYAQLVLLGKRLNGLTGHKLKVARRGDGRATQYRVSAESD